MLFSKTSNGKKISRQRLIAFQIIYIFEKIALKKPVSEVVNKGVIRNRWLQKLEIQAFTKKERVVGNFTIGIDWNQFLENKKLFGPKVTVPKDMDENKSAIWNVVEAADVFSVLVKKSGLQTRWLVYSDEEVDTDKVYNRIGVSKTKEYKWEKGTKKILFQGSPKNLTEIKLMIEVVEAG